MSNPLMRLQDWFAQQCDGDWEHCRGIGIKILDNPGWSFEADLAGTPQESAPFEGLERHRDEHDWVVCRVQEQRFQGFGGPHNLEEILETFSNWVDSAAN